MPSGEENNLEAMLKAYDLTPYNKCINVSYDALGALYEIPNYCIHDPMVYELPEDNKKKPNEKKIKFKARSGMKHLKLKSSNYSSVKKTKMSVAKKLGTTYDKIRLFFSGKEMKNDLQLWNYNVDNDVVIMVMLCFGLIGFMDDYLKSVKHKSDGLIAWEKMLLEILVTGVFMAYIILTHDGDTFITNVYVPFVDITVNLGILGYPIFFLAVIGTVNGVNFTDGVDGLAATVTLPVCAFYVFAGENTGILGTSMVAAATMGALFGFLMHNAHPAAIFMGDTGSLAIGGFVAASAYMTGTPIFVLIVGFVYWLEILSVMLQVSYFKITKGKRIFRMAPIHHHFELGGWSETKVVTVFASITAALCAVGICGL
jgi:phospho-N-acetylmuramoyl-pentapeptide-transferase